MPLPTLVQQAQGGASATPSSFTITMPANVAAANDVIVCAAAPGGTVDSVTGLGGTWTNIGADAGSGFWRCHNPNGSTAVITINVTGAVDVAGCASEWSTLTTPDVVPDAHQTQGVSTAPQTIAALSLTPTSYPYLLLIDFSANVTAAGVSAPSALGSGWTALTSKVQASHVRVDPRYKLITTPTGTYTAQWTENSNGTMWQAFAIFQAGGQAPVNGSATLAGVGDFSANGANVVPDNPLPLEVRVYAATAPLGSPLAVWQGQTGLAWSDLFNDTGAARLTLALADPKATAANLTKYNLVRCFLGPFDVFDFWIETPQYTVAGIAGASDERVVVAGRHLEAYLERAIVWIGGVAYGTVTAGAIMADLIATAQARGVIPLVRIDFTAASDSAGVAWAGTLATLSLTFAEGTDLLACLNQLRGLGVIARMRRDMTLQLFQTFGVDQRNAGVVLRQGRHLSSPVTWTLPLAHAGNYILIRGATTSTTATIAGNPEDTFPERFEGYMKGPDSDDFATLDQAGLAELAARIAATTAISLKDVDHGLGAGQFEPYRHYGLGDTLGLDVPGRFTATAEVVKALNVESGDAARYRLGVDLSGLQPSTLRDLSLAVRDLQRPPV